MNKWQTSRDREKSRNGEPYTAFIHMQKLPHFRFRFVFLYTLLCLSLSSIKRSNERTNEWIRQHIEYLQSRNIFVCWLFILYLYLRIFTLAPCTYAWRAHYASDTIYCKMTRTLTTFANKRVTHIAKLSQVKLKSRQNRKTRMGRSVCVCYE